MPETLVDCGNTIVKLALHPAPVTVSEGAPAVRLAMTEFSMHRPNALPVHRTMSLAFTGVFTTLLNLKKIGPALVPEFKNTNALFALPFRAVMTLFEIVTTAV